MARGDIKNRREVERLSASLPFGLNARQEKEARRSCAHAWLGKKTGWCDSCNGEFKHSLWDSRRKTMRCPVCGAKVDIKKSPRKYVSNNSYYFQVVDTMEGWQVVRTFLCEREARRRQAFCGEELHEAELTFSATEVFQRWMKEKTVPIIIGLPTHGMGWYYDQWNFNGKWTIRREDSQHRIGGWVATRPRILPELKRRGLRKLNDNCSPAGQIEEVFNAWEAEVLLKSGQGALFAAYVREPYRLKKYWPSIRVALRHRYEVKNVTMWLDLLYLLEQERRDLRNPHFICPENLKEAHDRWMDVRMRRLERLRKEKELREARELAEKLSEDGETNMRYRERMGELLGVVVVAGDIELHTLQNVREFYEEGEELHHCVFVNGYYEKERKLIIGARVNGQRMETIEVDMDTWQILQCRAVHNGQSAHHERIMQVMTDNMNKYRRVAQ